jgi:hypothetical protein
LRAALDSVFAAPVYRWETHRDRLIPLRRLWDAWREWLDRLGTESPTTLRLLTWLLVAILVAIFVHAAWIAATAIRAGKRSTRADGGPRTPTRDAAWYRAEADRLAAAGRYAEALQADFLRLMLELDARSVLRFHPSRTPNEYVREAALSEERRLELRDLVRTLYAYAFARVPCDRDAFDAWRRRATPERYARAS